MSLLRAISTQVQIWTAYERLTRPERQERWRAIETLRSIGPAALPCLRYAANPIRPPRMRFAAAVGLHGLEDPYGLKLLCEALVSLPSAESEDLAVEIEAAFVAIGSPDAVTALIDLFPHLDPTHTTLRVRCACSILATLRDPRALGVLSAYAEGFPDLFEKTVPAFGEMGVISLKQMASDPSPVRRRLAVNTLRHISSASSFQLLARLLRDNDISVRRLIPAALSRFNSSATLAEIEAAVREGFSSREAVEHIPFATPLLFALIQRWDPHHLRSSGDSPDAVLAALPLLSSSDIPTETLTPPLCRLIQDEIDPEIAAAAAHVIAARMPSSAEIEEQARQAFETGLTSHDPGLRQACSEGLESLRDPIGRQMQELLISCWPKESLLARLQTLLKGGQEANQAAAQTMQQFTQWILKVSRDTLDRLASSTPDASRTSPPTLDPRLPILLRELLRRALTALQHAKETDVTSDRLCLSIATIRSIGKLGAASATLARPELVCALHTVKGASLPDHPLPVYREVGEILRETAAIQLIELLGAESYGIFFDALQSPQTEVRQTAIRALGRLGDPRALTLLQRIAADVTHPNGAVAIEAISAIRRVNPEYMTLLRASEASASGATLLRPAQGNIDPGQTDLLLRPTQPSTDNNSSVTTPG